MMKAPKRRLFSALFILFLAVYWAGAVHSATDLWVEPVRIESLITPAGTCNGAIRLVNPSPDALRLRVAVRDWDMTGKGEPIFSPSGVKESSCAGWIRFNPRVFLLDPRKEQIVRYTVAAPKNVKPGEYRCAILFAAEPQKPDEEHLAVVGNVVSTVYICVKPVQRAGAVVSSVAEYRPERGLTVRTTLKSTGNAHIRFEGSFKILDGNGRAVGEGFYDGNVVFPGRERVLTGEWRGELPRGKYRVISDFSYLPPLYAKNMAEYGAARGLQAGADLNVE